MTTKNHRSLWGKAISIMILVAMLTGSAGATAFAQEVEQIAPVGQTLLVAPAMPDMQSIEIPTILEDEGMQRVIDQTMAKQYMALRHELRKLQQQGLIAEIVPIEGGLFRLAGVDFNTRLRLEKLSTIGAVQEDHGEIPACLLNLEETAPDRIKDMVQARQLQESMADGAEIQPVGLKINVYLSPYYNWSYVYGTGAPPLSEVRLGIVRGGVEVTYEYTFSDASGYYSFESEWLSCPEGRNSFEIVHGDTVKIFAGGVTKQTVVEPITGWADANTDVVFGSTHPYRSVRVNVAQLNRSAPCSEPIIKSKTGTANSAGDYSIDTTSLINFDRSADILLESLDASGHATYSYATQFHLVYIPSEFGYGIFLPDQAYTLKLERAGSIIETGSGSTEYDGWFEFDFDFAQVGDKVIFTSGSFNMTYNIVDANPFINLNTGQVSGSATPGLFAIAELSPGSDPVQTRCSGYICASATIPAGGSIDLNVGPAFKGEYIDVIFYTIEGEDFGYYLTDVVLAADLYWDEVIIDWPGGSNLTVTLKDSGGSTKEIANVLGAWNYVYFSADMVPGDMIEVTDGVRTETMVVQDLSQPRLNFNTKHLTGSAPVGPVLAEIFGQEEQQYACVETSGNYDLTAPWDVKAGEHAYVNFRGPDGYYTSAEAESLLMNFNFQYAYVFGNVETAGATLSWEHKRATEVKGSGLATPYYDKYFDFYLNEVPLAGDTLSFTTSDGNTGSITFPTLTANIDASGRRIYGQAPANRWVTAWVNRASPDAWYYIRYESHSSSTGQYSVSLPKEMVWSINCSQVDLAHTCIFADAEVTTADGFYFYWSQDIPLPPEDAFESDDDFTSASIINGIQAHTLDEWEDEDWVKFTVSAEDVAQSHNFHINTVQLGWDLDLYMELYGPNGTTLLASDFKENYDGSGQGPQLYYTFTTPGDYYLRIHSNPAEGDWDGGYCDSVYTLLIIPDEQFLYLPTIGR